MMKTADFTCTIFFPKRRQEVNLGGLKITPYTADKRGGCLAQTKALYLAGTWASVTH